MTKELVIYHGGCRDGFASAWVMHTKFQGEADFHAGFYGQDPPSCAGRRVVLVDFSYPRAQLEAMAAEAKSIIILDHHKTAAEDLEGLTAWRNVQVLFDMNRSGAGIAWDYCNPGQQRPWLVDYVEDRDLWRHRLPSSREVNAWISALPYDFAAWDAQAKLPLTYAIEAGASVMLKIQQYVMEMKKSARRVVFQSYNVPIVNAPQLEISELLDALAQGERFAVGWWQRADGVYQYSLRSRNGFDVSALAKLYGGGGHVNAAGFERHEPPGWSDSPFCPPDIEIANVPVGQVGAVPAVAR